MPHFGPSSSLATLSAIALVLWLSPLTCVAASQPNIVVIYAGDLGYGDVQCYNLATYDGVQWANGYEDPASFQPENLDIEQWMRAAVSAGMQYAVLTVKHTGGWSLWDSALTDSHDMEALENYRNGEGDITREFVEACRKHGLKVGLYYCCPRDFGHPEGNTIPSEVCDVLGPNWFWNPEEAWTLPLPRALYRFHLE